MPKFLTFNYTKENGDTSERVILTINSATDLFLSFDITEGIETDTNFNEVYRKIEAARAEFYRKMYDIARDYGVPIKSFKQGRMSNVHDLTKEYTEFG